VKFVSPCCLRHAALCRFAQASHSIDAWGVK
jgi:hypothetical protein